MCCLIVKAEELFECKDFWFDMRLLIVIVTVNIPLHHHIVPLSNKKCQYSIIANMSTILYILKKIVENLIADLSVVPLPSKGSH